MAGKKKKKKKKKTADSGTSGHFAGALYHDDLPRDYSPRFAYARKCHQYTVDNLTRTWQGTWMKRFFPYDVFGRLASLNINVIILLLKCSHCVFHMACLRQNGWKREREKKNSRQRYLWTLRRSVVQWRCTTRFRPAVRLCQPEMVPPDKTVRGRKVGP